MSCLGAQEKWGKKNPKFSVILRKIKGWSRASLANPKLKKKTTGKRQEWRWEEKYFRDAFRNMTEFA